MTLLLDFVYSDRSIIFFRPYRICLTSQVIWCRYFARLLTRHTWLWTEMVVDSTINHKVGAEADRWLEFNVCQKPVVLQLGGSKPETLAAASKVARQYG